MFVKLWHVPTHRIVYYYVTICIILRISFAHVIFLFNATNLIFNDDLNKTTFSNKKQQLAQHKRRSNVRHWSKWIFKCSISIGICGYLTILYKYRHHQCTITYGHFHINTTNRTQRTISTGNNSKCFQCSSRFSYYKYYRCYVGKCWSFRQE